MEAAASFGGRFFYAEPGDKCHIAYSRLTAAPLQGIARRLVGCLHHPADHFDDGAHFFFSITRLLPVIAAMDKWGNSNREYMAPFSAD